jgi:hypothetical protein
MKKFLPFILAAALGLTQANIALAKDHKKTAKQAAVQKVGLQAITDSLFNFGKIEAGKPVSTVFKFTNTSSKPIIISNVQTSCGCTTPEFNKAPVMPGKTTDIKVGYNAAMAGSFYKSITISYGANEQKIIYIQGEVI